MAGGTVGSVGHGAVVSVGDVPVGRPRDTRTLQCREATSAERPEWDALVASVPNGDPLQAWGWGDVVAASSRERPVRLIVRDAGGRARGAAQVLVRSSAVGLRVLYVPHGPTWDAAAADGPAVLDELLEGIRAVGRREHGVVAKLDLRSAPDLPAGLLDDMLLARGLRRARHSLQLRSTRILDLGMSTDELFATLEKDTRNAVRRAAREGVVARVVRDADVDAYATLGSLVAAVGTRTGTPVRSPEFLARLGVAFAGGGSACLVLAEHGSRPIAGCLALATGPRAFYLYAGSLREPGLRHAFGPYAALWALCLALAADHRTSLDLWGVSDPDDPDADPSWEGYSHFKRGFGGTSLRHPGVYDLVLDPLWFRVRDWRERVAGRTQAQARAA